MNRVAPYRVDGLPGATPVEVVEITTRLSDAYDAPVVVTYRTPDRVVRRRLTAAGLVLLASFALGMCDPFWAAMPWYVPVMTP